MFVPNFEAMSHVTSVLGPENHLKSGLIEKRLKYVKKDFTGLLSEVESRTQGSRPRTEKKNPRPRPRTALPRTDPLEAKDRNARGQGQGHKRKCFPKKKGLQKNFSGDRQKNSLQKNFSDVLHEKTPSEIFFRRSTKFEQFKKSAVLESRTGQFSRA